MSPDLQVARAEQNSDLQLRGRAIKTLALAPFPV